MQLGSVWIGYWYLDRCVDLVYIIGHYEPKPYWWNEQESSKPARAMKKAAQLFEVIKRGLAKKPRANIPLISEDPLTNEEGEEDQNEEEGDDAGEAATGGDDVTLECALVEENAMKKSNKESYYVAAAACDGDATDKRDMENVRGTDDIVGGATTPAVDVGGVGNVERAFTEKLVVTDDAPGTSTRVAAGAEIQADADAGVVAVAVARDDASAGSGSLSLLAERFAVREKVLKNCSTDSSSSAHDKKALLQPHPQQQQEVEQKGKRLPGNIRDSEMRGDGDAQEGCGGGEAGCGVSDSGGVRRRPLPLQSAHRLRHGKEPRSTNWNGGFKG